MLMSFPVVVDCPEAGIEEYLPVTVNSRIVLTCYLYLFFDVFQSNHDNKVTTNSLFTSNSETYDFLREKSEFRARTLRSAEHALAFSETWSNTIIDFLMKINNL